MSIPTTKYVGPQGARDPDFTPAADTSRGYSNSIWGDCPWELFESDPGAGRVFFDDFVNFPVHNSDQATQKYASYIDTGVTIQQLATEVGGVIQIAGNNADNDQGAISTGGDTGGFLKFATGKALWCEARIRQVTSVADTRLAFFIGLAEEGLATDDAVFADNPTAMKDLDYVGFRVLDADGDGLDAIHRTSGGGAEVVVKNEAKVMTAGSTDPEDDWVKVGFKMDPANDTVYWYVDGLRVGSGVLITATDFPDGEELSMVLATKVQGTVATLFDMDWWRAAQAA